MELSHIFVFVGVLVPFLNLRLVRSLIVLKEYVGHHEGGHFEMLTVLQVNVGQSSQFLQIVQRRYLLKELRRTLPELNIRKNG